MSRTAYTFSEGVSGIDAAGDDTIAVVRYVYTTPDSDVPDSRTSVYVGPLDGVKTLIEHDSQGDDDEIIENASLMFVSPAHFAGPLGFENQMAHSWASPLSAAECEQQMAAMGSHCASPSEHPKP